MWFNCPTKSRFQGSPQSALSNYPALPDAQAPVARATTNAATKSEVGTAQCKRIVARDIAGLWCRSAVRCRHGLVVLVHKFVDGERLLGQRDAVARLVELDLIKDRAHQSQTTG